MHPIHTSHRWSIEGTEWSLKHQQGIISTILTQEKKIKVIIDNDENLTRNPRARRIKNL